MSQLHKYVPLTYPQIKKIISDMEYIKYNLGDETPLSDSTIYQLKHLLNTFYDDDAEYIQHSIKNTLPQATL